MSSDRYAVFGHYQVRLDKIRTLFHRQQIGFERMLRHVATRASMGDDGAVISERYGSDRTKKSGCSDKANNPKQRISHVVHPNINLGKR